MKLTLPMILTLSLSFLALCGLVVFLIMTDRDPVLFLTTLPLIVVALGNLFQLNKVDKQTNGTNQALRVENAQLRSIMSPEQASLVPVITATALTESVPVAPLEGQDRG